MLLLSYYSIDTNDLFLDSIVTNDLFLDSIGTNDLILDRIGTVVLTSSWIVLVLMI